MRRVWEVRRGKLRNMERSGGCLKGKRHVNCLEGPIGATQMTGNSLGKEIAWEDIATMKKGCGVTARNKTRKATQTGTELWTMVDYVQGTILLSIAKDTKACKSQLFSEEHTGQPQSEVRWPSIRVWNLSGSSTPLWEPYSQAPSTRKAPGPALNSWCKISVQQML